MGAGTVRVHLADDVLAALHEIDPDPSTAIRKALDAEQPPLATSELEEPLLMVLRAAGGAMAASHAAAAVETLLGDRLGPADREVLVSGQQRWRAKLSQARHSLVLQGRMAKSPSGWWTLP